MAWSLGVLGIGVLQLLFLGILLYFFVALKRAYRQGWILTAAKYAVILGSYWAVFVFVTWVVFLVVLTA